MATMYEIIELTNQLGAESDVEGATPQQNEEEVAHLKRQLSSLLTDIFDGNEKASSLLINVRKDKFFSANYHFRIEFDCVHQWKTS